MTCFMLGLHDTGLEKMVEELDSNLHMDLWDFEGIHYFDDGPLTVQYLFVLDALNFCFWPGMFELCIHIDTQYIFDKLCCPIEE